MPEHSAIIFLGCMWLVAVVVYLMRPLTVVTPGMEAVSLEKKLAILAACGLKLAPAFNVDDLLKSFPRPDYEQRGFDLVLVGLGMTEETKPWRNRCQNLWHFDTECIEDNGDYRKIAERMAEMAQGSLPLGNIEDCVDLERKQAWVAFDFKGQRIRIDCRVEDDWVDPAVFGRFAELLRQSDRSKVFISYDLGGQDLLVGCVAQDQLKQLKDNGINFRPLS